MSAQVYPPQVYRRPVNVAYNAQQPAVASRARHPLSNAAVNHPAAQQQMVQQQANLHNLPQKVLVQQQQPDKIKEPASPPLPRQKSKTTPPSPPKVICDTSGHVQFNRIGFLGEGGFARVYEVKDPRGVRFACKVIARSALTSKKAKTKLYAEIKIHRSLEHPNIVRFQDCFEDGENVYMTLELCCNGSLMDMLRRRRRFTEPEARFFMVQLIGACHYLHTHQVIHRDLKLGNIFLDSEMNVKVGDFGLAALIENPGERKKTICGTPNYIAPEVLFDTVNGHSFEVDTWSLGVILYTFVIGRPPFQTKEVKVIYQRIRDNVYEFPVDRQISTDVQHLIQQILLPDPSMRPSLHEIIQHPFFINGIVPGYIPVSALESPPDFRFITRSQSESNLRRLRRHAFLDEDQQTSISISRAANSNSNAANAPTDNVTKSITSSIAQQEKEFQKAVQPGSPISALLSSARQPLIVGPAATNGYTGENNLLRKLQAAKETKSRQARAQQAIDEQAAMSGTTGALPRTRGDDQEEEMRHKKKELESQKARIVAQMVPVREEDDGDGEGERETEGERENMPPPPLPTTASATSVSSKRVRETIRAAREKENPLPPIPSAAHRDQTAQSTATATGSSAIPPQQKLNAFDAAAHVLTLAFDARAAGRMFRDPREDAHLPIPEERVFIVSWVDYCNKYGMGYALTDGTVGVHFNDSTSLVLSPDKRHFDYITSRHQGTVYYRKSYTVENYPEDLKSKVYLLKHFEKYIMERLYSQYEYTFEDTGRTKGMEWVQKYLRMKHVIVFKLSHDVLQFNFYDHTKLILSSHGLLITYIDKSYKMTRWTLSQVMAFSLKPQSVIDAMNPDEVKFLQKLTDKLKYCKEVLLSIKSASANTGTVGGSGSASSAAGSAEDLNHGVGGTAGTGGTAGLAEQFGALNVARGGTSTTSSGRSGRGGGDERGQVYVYQQQHYSSTGALPKVTSKVTLR
ncbi:hypothetical protein AX16_005874 [Volvariella volvacea WC 439]|nr:hypothetical protein AX16_005874 [Volvariella volvacea WC 439]